MIDLHSHLLPGVDDGSPSDEVSIEMARMAVAEGITIQACTPHMFPGVYNNNGPDVKARVANLQDVLEQAGVPLQLVVGADVHVAPDLVARLRSGDALTINGSRYLLLETPHHVLPPRVEEVFFDLMAAGYLPILTHPERMTWIGQRYDLIKRLVTAGAWMQLTAGALTGKFGAKARYWSERMLDDQLFHIVATDAHDTIRRPPAMRDAYALLTTRVGEEEAMQMAVTRPKGILEDRAPGELVARQTPTSTPEAPAPFWRRLADIFGGR